MVDVMKTVTNSKLYFKEKQIIIEEPKIRL